MKFPPCQEGLKNLRLFILYAVQVVFCKLYHLMKFDRINIVEGENGNKEVGRLEVRG